MKALDLNKAKRQAFAVTMMDDAKTTLNLVVPNVTTIQKLKAIGSEIAGALDSDEGAINACYDIAADLFSCNRLQIRVTAEDLRGKYRMELEDLILFFNAYLEFISDLTKSKN